MELGLKGRTALVTGGANGIGAETARRLYDEGAQVVIADIHGEKAAAQAAEIDQGAGRVIGVRADVTDEDSVAQLIARAVEAFGGVDILINNAGFTRDMRITKMSIVDWDSVVDVILKGAFLCTRAVLPLMQQRQWGRVINVASRAHLGNPGQANYSAAKAGLIGFTRAMSLENGRYQITVNAVAPGIIETEMVRALPHFEKIRENAEKSLPIARLGTARDVADVITFIASERAGYVTGDIVHVTGGRYG